MEVLDDMQKLLVVASNLTSDGLQARSRSAVQMHFCKGRCTLVQIDLRSRKHCRFLPLSGNPSVSVPSSRNGLTELRSTPGVTVLSHRPQSTRPKHHLGIRCDAAAAWEREREQCLALLATAPNPSRGRERGGQGLSVTW